jgi:hypothetical protein
MSTRFGYSRDGKSAIVALDFNVHVARLWHIRRGNKQSDGYKSVGQGLDRFLSLSSMNVYHKKQIGMLSALTGAGPREMGMQSMICHEHTSKFVIFHSICT